MSSRQLLNLRHRFGRDPFLRSTDKRNWGQAGRPQSRAEVADAATVAAAAAFRVRDPHFCPLQKQQTRCGQFATSARRSVVRWRGGARARTSFSSSLSSAARGAEPIKTFDTRRRRSTAGARRPQRKTFVNQDWSTRPPDRPTWANSAFSSAAAAATPSLTSPHFSPHALPPLSLHFPTMLRQNSTWTLGSPRGSMGERERNCFDSSSNPSGKVGKEGGRGR